MTDRIPLIVNSGAAQIQELPAGDNLSITGNITASYFVGNGSQLTGLAGNYGNSNVSTYLASGTNTANVITTGNITGGNLTTGGVISATGNVAGNYFIGNGSQLTGVATSVDFTAVASNIIPTGNSVYNLGNATNQWNDLFLSNATIYMNSVPISLAAGNVLTVNGADVVTTAANGEASIGNLDIFGATISIANGAPETYINLSSSVEGWAYVQVPTDGAANTYNTRIHNDAGNVEIGTGDYSTGSTNYTWTLDNTGNLNLPNNGDINFAGGGLKQVVNEDFYIRASDNEADGWSIYNVVDDGAGNTLTQTRLAYNDFTVRTNAQGAAYTWAFRDSGVLDLPGDIYGNVGGNLTIKIGDQAGSNTFIDLQTRSYVGDALISNIRIANPNVTISTANAAQNWTFGSTGNLTVPGNIQSISTGFAFSSGIVAINYSTPPVITTADNVFSGSETGQVTISGVNPPVQANGTWYYEAVATNGFALYLDAGLTQPVDTTGWPGYVDGGLAVSLGYSNLAITGGNVSIVSNYGETWTFEAGGALRIPNDIVSNATIDLDNRASGNTADIRLYAADDIQLQGRDKPNDSEAEGGDINIYGGIGAAAVTSGFDTGGGGDVQIGAGDGGSDTGGGFGGSAGGTITIFSGDGGTGSDTTNAGSGGSLGITAGAAAVTANTALGGIGGSITITAGDTTRINEIGGTISLNTGAASGDGTSPAGYLEINIPSSNVGPGGTWTFSGTGTELNVPGNSSIYGANFGNFTVGCAGNTIVTSSVYGSGNVNNWVFGSTGNLTLPTINLGTGLDAQAVIQSQRKLIPPFRWSAVISGTTPTVVYNATDVNTTSMKVTMQIQHQGLGMEFFEVFATFTGSDTYYTVSNRVSPPAIDASTVVVGLGEGNVMKITVTINSGAGTSWVTYDAVEFGIPND